MAALMPILGVGLTLLVAVLIVISAAKEKHTQFDALAEGPAAVFFASLGVGFITRGLLHVSLSYFLMGILFFAFGVLLLCWIKNGFRWP